MSSSLPTIELYNQYKTSEAVAGFFKAFHSYLDEYYYSNLSADKKGKGLDISSNIEVSTAGGEWLKTLGGNKYGVETFALMNAGTLWDSFRYDDGYLWDYEGGRLELTPDIYRRLCFWVLNQSHREWTTATFYDFLKIVVGEGKDENGNPYVNGGFSVQSTEGGFVLSGVEQSIPYWVNYCVQYKRDFLGLPYGVNISVLI